MRSRRVVALLALTFALVAPQRADATTVATAYTVGAQPFSVAIDPVDGRVYVANSASLDWGNKGLVSVIDPASGTVGRLATSGRSNFVAVDGGARRLYSSNDNRTLDVFDLSTMTLAATLPVGGLSVAVDTAAHRVYVLNGRRMDVVDGTSNTVIGSVAAPYAEGWFGLALDPELHRVYILDSYPYSAGAPGPALDVLDDRDLTLVTRLPLPVIARYAVAVDDVRHRVVVAGPYPSDGSPSFSSGYLAYDGATLALLYSSGPTARTYAGGLVYDRSRDRYFETDFSNGYRVFDGQSYQVTDVAVLPWTPGLAAVAGDGRTYVAEYQDPAAPSGPGKVALLQFGNAAPAVGTMWFTPASPTTDDTLRAWAEVSDPDFPACSMGCEATLSYEWSVNGVRLAGETGQALDLSVAGHGDRGDTVSVVITASDAWLSAARSASVTIGNAAPVVAVTLSTSAPLTNDVLSARASTSDADGDAVSLSYQWTRNAAVLSGATGPTLDLSAYGDRGDVIVVTVTADDGRGGTRAASATATVADSAPSALGLSVNGTTFRTNDVLRATLTSVDPDRDQLAYAFAFKVNGVLVQTTYYTVSDSATFDLGLPAHGERGDTVTIEAFACDCSLASATLTTSVTIVNTPPAVDVSLSSAAPTRRDVLVATARATDADGDTGLVYTYTWTVGQKVRQVTTTTSATDGFDLRGYNVGDVVRLSVVANDGFGASAPASASAKISAR